MKKLTSLSIIFLSLISCAKKNESNFQPQTTMADTLHIMDTTLVTYLALGDSYTVG